MKKAVIVVLLLAFVSGAVVWAPVTEARVTVECEDTTATYDKLFSPIAVVEGSACSGGFSLQGVDCPGEWAESALNITALGTWSVGLRCRGDFGVSYTINLTLTGTQTGNSQSIDLFFTGAGYG